MSRIKVLDPIENEKFPGEISEIAVRVKFLFFPIHCTFHKRGIVGNFKIISKSFVSYDVSTCGIWILNIVPFANSVFNIKFKSIERKEGREEGEEILVDWEEKEKEVDGIDVGFEVNWSVTFLFPVIKNRVFLLSFPESEDKRNRLWGKWENDGDGLLDGWPDGWLDGWLDGFRVGCIVGMKKGDEEWKEVGKEVGKKVNCDVGVDEGWEEGQPVGWDDGK